MSIEQAYLLDKLLAIWSIDRQYIDSRVDGLYYLNRLKLNRLEQTDQLFFSRLSKLVYLSMYTKKK